MQLYQHARRSIACAVHRPSLQAAEPVDPGDLALHPVQLLQGVVAAIDEPADNVRIVRIRSDRPLAFSPGQYAKLRFVGGLERVYSIASVDGDDLLEFHIRIAPGESAGSLVVRQLRIGDGLGVSGPHGTSYLRRSHDGPVICVAGGTGLAPVLSIVRSVLEAGSQHPVHLYYGEKVEADVYAAERLHELTNRFPNLTSHITVEARPAGLGRRIGSVTSALAEDWNEPGSLRNFRAYIGGSPAMACAARDLLVDRGMDAEHVYSDALPGRVETAA